MSRRTVIASLIATVGLYVLSYGPTTGWHLARGSSPPNGLRAFYAPIEGAHRTPVEAPFAAYLYLWIAIYGGRAE